VRVPELETRVGRLGDDPPLALGSVDLTIGNPVPLRQKFDEIFAYIAAVESAVAQNVADITTLLPDLGDQERRFLDVWSNHELAHAAIFDALVAELGLPTPSGARPSAPPPANGLRARPSFRVFGALSASRWLQDVFKLIYLSRGAMHEHLTYDCYRHLGAQLTALGEHALVNTVTEPIRRQEAAHLGYYRLAAATHRRGLTETQVRLARGITVLTYQPVGAGECGRDAAGRVFSGLAGSERAMDQALDAVEGLADELLGDGNRPLPPFVHAAMDGCLDGPARRRPPYRLRARWS
jgi:hypothetical protein